MCGKHKELIIAGLLILQFAKLRRYELYNNFSDEIVNFFPSKKKKWTLILST